MLRIPTPNRRLAGRLMVVTAIAVALPLTASRAVKYLDVPMRTAAHETAKSMPAGLVPAVTLAAAQPQAAAVVEAAARQDSPRYEGDISISGDLITIDGRTKRWEDLTPAERSRVKAAVATARSALEQTHFDAAKMRDSLAAIPGPEQIGEIQRKLARSQASLAESVRKLDEDAARARAAGRQPDELQNAIRNLLNSVQTVDLQNASRAVADIDREKIAADVAQAPDSIEKAKAELARIQARIDADRPR